MIYELMLIRSTNKMTAFWEKVVAVERRFSGAYCLQNEGNECPNVGGQVSQKAAVRTLNVTIA